MKNDPFGDRMKAYEAVETGRRLDPTLPVYARIDGRGFSRFTRGLRRPFDERMSFAMRETVRHLIRETGARLGYTQSDEISLIWHVPADVPGSQMFFDGKVQKLCSVLSGIAAASFGRTVATFHDPEFAAYAARLPHFDARVFNLPDQTEGANAFLWREFDATRNAVSMAAHAHFSAKQLHGVSVESMRGMLAEAGVDFEAYPVFFKRGTYLRRISAERELTAAELASIPEKFRPAPGTKLMRSDVACLDMPPFVTVKNRAAVVFDAADPIAEEVLA